MRATLCSTEAAKLGPAEVKPLYVASYLYRSLTACDYNKEGTFPPCVQYMLISTVMLKISLLSAPKQEQFIGVITGIMEKKIEITII